MSLSSSAHLTKKMDKVSTDALEQSLELLANANGPTQKMMMELWRETSDSKLQGMLEYVNELLESGKRFLLFAHHQPIIDAFAEMFDKDVRF